MKNGKRCPGGRGGPSRPRRWPRVRRSCSGQRRGAEQCGGGRPVRGRTPDRGEWRRPAVSWSAGWTVWSMIRGPAVRRASPLTRSRMSWLRRWNRRRRTPRTGHGRRWPNGPGSQSQRSGGSGSLSNSSPTAAEGFKLSNDPLFVEKVYDVVGLLPEPARSAVRCPWTRSPRPRGAGPVPAGIPDDARHEWNTNPTPFTWTKTAEQNP